MPHLWGEPAAAQGSPSSFPWPPAIWGVTLSWLSNTDMLNSPSLSPHKNPRIILLTLQAVELRLRDLKDLSAAPRFTNAI